jgi:HJR/Mrr/RecB family endonuclease
MARQRSRQTLGSPLGWGLLVAGLALFLGLQDVLGSVSATVTVLGIAAALSGGVLLWLRVRSRQDWLRHARTLQDLVALTPTQFELAVGELLRASGYKDVRHTGGSGDLAADLVCRAADGSAVVVQCKRYALSRSVGSPEIQQFIGMQIVHHKAQTGIFVTTGTFTGPALSLAHKHGLRTIDGAELAAALERLHQAQPPR